jgi:hypothetical protein
MVWKVTTITLVLAAAGWTQTSGGADQPSGPRSPFASPVRTAQATPQAPAQTATKPAATKAGTAATKPQTKPRATAARPRKPLTKKTVTPAANVAVPEKKPAVAASPQPAPPAVPAAPKLTGHERDPFATPASTALPSPCSTGGKKCLVIGKIALKGVVQAASGYIAVVVNASNHAYFLRVNDPVFDGYVERITSDTVIFKEVSKDRFGHQVTRDVTKKLGAPSA